MTDHQIASLAQLEALYDTANTTNAGSLLKETGVITNEYRRLIEASPFMAMATVGPGGADCSPRGDQPAVVTVVDEQTIHIPDRRGNNRIDSLRNIVVDGRVALMFLLPGTNLCVRVNGTAVVVTDPEVLASCTVASKAPKSVVVVTTHAVYFQCARAIKRSTLWDPEQFIDPATLPTVGDVMIAVTGGDFDGATYDAELEDRQNRTLY